MELKYAILIINSAASALPSWALRLEKAVAKAQGAHLYNISDCSDALVDQILQNSIPAL